MYNLNIGLLCNGRLIRRRDEIDKTKDISIILIKSSKQIKSYILVYVKYYKILYILHKIFSTYNLKGVFVKYGKVKVNFSPLLCKTTKNNQIRKLGIVYWAHMRGRVGRQPFTHSRQILNARFKKENWQAQGPSM